jgi:hypothetical protein
MGLLVVDHLHPVLGGPQPAVGFAELAGEIAVQIAGSCESGERSRGSPEP